jgi:hypothetical protein
MTIKRGFLILVMLLLIVGVFAMVRNYSRKKAEGAGKVPDAMEEYRKIMNHYIGKEPDTEISGNIRIYDGENNGTLKETGSFHCARSGVQFFTRINYLQTFCDGELVLDLDTVNKVILISKAEESKNTVEHNPVDPVGVFISDTTKIQIGEIKTAGNAERIITIKTDLNPEIRAVRYFYDTISYRVRQTEVEWWRTNPVMDDNKERKIWLARIDYVYQKAALMKIKEKIRSIVEVNGKKVKPGPLYSDYQINSNL